MPDLRKLDLAKLTVAVDGKELGAFRRSTFTVYRAKVPGGWLVLGDGGNGLSGVTFYPDPRHEWDGGSED
jgi:hypothetical protein